jgi:hypothetical protein
MRTTTEKKKIIREKPVVSKDTSDYSNDPVFVKKHEHAIEFVKKHGLPEPSKKR